MSIVGTQVREKGRHGRDYTVVGQDGGQYVIAPAEFGEPERVSLADLYARFGAQADAPAIDLADAEQRGWRVLAGVEDPDIRDLREHPEHSAHLLSPIAARTGSYPLAGPHIGGPAAGDTPEDVFKGIAAHGDDWATERARTIIATPWLRDSVKAGTFTVPTQVLAEVRRLLAEENVDA